MPFVIAFQGDPAQMFYCADYPMSYELIPRTRNYTRYAAPLQRLLKFMRHHVSGIGTRVLIHKAG